VVEPFHGVPVLVRAAPFDLLASAPSGQRRRRDALPPPLTPQRFASRRHASPSQYRGPADRFDRLVSDAKAREAPCNESPVLQLTPQEWVLAQSAAPGFDRHAIASDLRRAVLSPVGTGARLAQQFKTAAILDGKQSSAQR
jgi:hypothetical protein